MILGATGSLGRHVLRQAVAADHAVTVSVRTPSKLPPEVRERVSVHTGDLSAVVPPDLVSGQDALINCAGHVADGERFVGLIDRLVSCVELLPAAEQPVCWLLAGAALLGCQWGCAGESCSRAGGPRGVEAQRPIGPGANEVAG